MFTLPWRRPLPLALLILPLSGGAAPPDALDASAPVPLALHESAFKNYRSHADATVRDWRTTNDTVGRIGGWRAYAREANPPAPAPAKQPASSPAPEVPSAPAAGHHSGHQKGETP